MSYTCQIKSGKRLYYYQGRRIAKGRIPNDILPTIQCTNQTNINVSRLVNLPKELQIQTLLYLPIYDIIRLSFVTPQLAWIRGCDRSAYELWREIGKRLQILDERLLSNLLYPMSVLEWVGTDKETAKSFDFSILNLYTYDAERRREKFLLRWREQLPRLGQMYVRRIVQIYAGLLRMLTLAYALGEDKFANDIYALLANEGEASFV